MGAPAPEQQPSTASRILLVGPPGPAVGELLTRLREFGYPSDYANGGDLALRQLALRSYRFVVLIEEGLGQQAPGLCRSIRKTFADPATCPRLVVIARQRAVLPQMDAWLAGCHKYMVAPLNRYDLPDYLKQFSVA